MASNNSSPNLLDLLPPEVAVGMKSIEFLMLPFSLAFVVGMYKGVEINHPVYAVLFCNAAFSLATTLFNALSSFAPFSFNSWCFLSFLVNMLSQLFHLVSWSVVSILRYVYILKKDWLNQKFPDPSMLKVFSLIGVWSFYVLLMIIFVLNFVVLYLLPYGFMVNKTFFELPKAVQLGASLVSLFVFLTPVLVSFVFYYLLLKAKTTNHSEEYNSSSGVHDFSRGNNHPNDNESKGHSISVEEHTVNPRAGNLPYPLNSLLNVDDDSEESVPANDPNHHSRLSKQTQLGTGSNKRGGHARGNEVINAELMPISNKELEAALRSMKSNFILFLIFSVNILIFYLPESEGKILAGIALEIILKFALPTVTTIANFTPVKDMVKFYFQSLICRSSIYDLEEE